MAHLRHTTTPEDTMNTTTTYGPTLDEALAFLATKIDQLARMADNGHTFVLPVLADLEALEGAAFAAQDAHTEHVDTQGHWDRVAAWRRGELD